jgi:hypothetical protein
VCGRGWTRRRRRRGCRPRWRRSRPLRRPRHCGLNCRPRRGCPCRRRQSRSGWLRGRRLLDAQSDARRHETTGDWYRPGRHRDSGRRWRFGYRRSRGRLHRDDFLDDGNRFRRSRKGWFRAFGNFGQGGRFDKRFFPEPRSFRRRCVRSDCLHQPRRPECRCSGLWGLRFLGRGASLLPANDRRLSEHVAAGQ